jgi:hypothetical protein
MPAIQLLLRSTLIISSHPRLGLPSGLFPSSLPTNIPLAPSLHHTLLHNFIRNQCQCVFYGVALTVTVCMNPCNVGFLRSSGLVQYICVRFQWSSFLLLPCAPGRCDLHFEDRPPEKVAINDEGRKSTSALTTGPVGTVY